MKSDTLRLSNPFAGHAGCRVCLPRLLTEVETVSGVRFVRLTEGADGDSIEVEYDSSLLTSQKLQVQFIQISKSIQADVRHETLQIGNMDCPDCAASLDRAIQKIDGVLWSNASFTGAKLQVEFDNNRTGLHQIMGVVENRGLHPISPYASDDGLIGNTPHANPFDSDQAKTIQTIGAVCLTLLSLLPNISHYLVITCSLLAIVIGGRVTARAAWFALKSRSLDMNVLMSVAVLGAAALGDWTEAASVVALFSLGNLLQSRAFAKTRRGLTDLISLTPGTATLVDGLDGRTVRLEEINQGDLLVVRPGERIPVDGIVSLGSSQVNQAPITGESMPTEKTIGDTVFAGTLNGNGALQVRATKRSADSTLARIIHRVEVAREQRAPLQATIERFAAWYTPTVLSIAIIVALIPPTFSTLLHGYHATIWATWLLKGISLLIIACPCALVIATPVALVTAIGTASRRGALVKDGATLESIGKLKRFYFDKTGTITTGEFQIDRIEMTPGFEEKESLRLAARVETWSDHPLAQAIVKSVLLSELTSDPGCSGVQVFAGKGVVANVEGRTVVVGSSGFLRSMGVTLRRDFSDSFCAMVCVGLDGALAAVIHLADTVRPEAKDVVYALKSLGVPVELLSGDNGLAASSAASSAGIDIVHAELLPEAKLEFIQNAVAIEPVGMIGDGYNDAPALAASTVGFAMAASGNETAIETADVALISNDLTSLPWLVQLSRNTTNIIQQNIAAAIFTKFALAVGAIFIGIPLWLAVFGDVGVTLIVTINSLRLSHG